MKFDLDCIILAGGKSSRMGENKSLLPFGEFDTIAEFQFKRLRLLFTNIYISVKNRDGFGFDADFIEDRFELFSPACAILNTLTTLKKSIFVLSVDTPFVDENVINQLIGAYRNKHICTIAASGEKLHALCGIYDIANLKIFEKMVEKNEHKLQNIIQNLQHQVVRFHEENLFLNINYPQDYEKAKKLI